MIIYFKRIVVLIMLSFYAGIIMANGEKAMVVKQKDGKTFNLFNFSDMAFSKGNLWIYTTNNNFAFEISNIELIYFVDIPSSSDVLDVTEKQIKITNYSNDKIVIDGVGIHEPIKIYSIEGKIQNNCVNFANNKAEVLLSALSPGVYIINISNKKSLKVYKR